MKKTLLSLLIIFTTSLVAQTSCSTAIDITGNGTITTPTYTTSTFSGGCLATKANIKAIWYKYTATSNGEVTLSSNLTANDGTSYTDDTRISAFKGTCSALTCIGSNDDISGSNYLSTVTIPVASGQTYYFQWDNYWGLDTASPNLGLQFTFTFAAVSCIRPGLADFYLPGNYTTTSVNLFWNQAIGSPSNYDTDWSTSFATAAGSGTILSASTLVAGSPAYAYSSPSGITASSNIRYYIRSNCGGSQSAWVGPNFAYLAKILPFTHTFDVAADNYTNGFIGFSRFTSSGTSTPANYADGGAGTAMYTYNSTTVTSNLKAFTRAISLQANELVTVNFKTRLWAQGTISPMTFDLTVGTDQNPATTATVIQNFTESSDAAYTTRTATWTAPTAGIYYFGIHNKAAAGNQTFLFIDTIAMTSVLSTDEFATNAFAIFPNPATNEVRISSDGTYTINNIYVTDLKGRIVKEKTVESVGNATINIGDLTNGVYLMTINSSAGSSVKKIVKN